jgi:hypothetical protein
MRVWQILDPPIIIHGGDSNKNIPEPSVTEKAGKFKLLPKWRKEFTTKPEFFPLRDNQMQI